LWQAFSYSLVQGYYYTYMVLILVRLSLCFCLRAFSALFAPLAELCSILNFLKIIFIFLVINQCSFLLLIHPIVEFSMLNSTEKCSFVNFFFKNWRIFLVKIRKFSSFSKITKVLPFECSTFCNSTFWTFYLLFILPFDHSTFWLFYLLSFYLLSFYLL